MSTFSETVSTDAMLSVLADETRRAVLQYLLHHPDRWVSVEELATELGESVPDSPGVDSRLGLELHHSHLPKLDQVDLVTYDGTSVRYHHHDEVERLLGFIVDRFEGGVATL